MRNRGAEVLHQIPFLGTDDRLIPRKLSMPVVYYITFLRQPIVQYSFKGVRGFNCGIPPKARMVRPLRIWCGSGVRHRTASASIRAIHRRING